MRPPAWKDGEIEAFYRRKLTSTDPVDYEAARAALNEMRARHGDEMVDYALRDKTEPVAAPNLHKAEPWHGHRFGICDCTARQRAEGFCDHY